LEASSPEHLLLRRAGGGNELRGDGQRTGKGAWDIRTAESEECRGEALGAPETETGKELTNAGLRQEKKGLDQFFALGGKPKLDADRALRDTTVVKGKTATPGSIQRGVRQKIKVLE